MKHNWKALLIVIGLSGIIFVREARAQLFVNAQAREAIWLKQHGNHPPTLQYLNLAPDTARWQAMLSESGNLGQGMQVRLADGSKFLAVYDTTGGVPSLRLINVTGAAGGQTMFVRADGVQPNNHSALVAHALRQRYAGIPPGLYFDPCSREMFIAALADTGTRVTAAAGRVYYSNGQENYTFVAVPIQQSGMGWLQVRFPGSGHEFRLQAVESGNLHTLGCTSARFPPQTFRGFGSWRQAGFDAKLDAAQPTHAPQSLTPLLLEMNCH